MNEPGTWRASAWSEHPLCFRYQVVCLQTQLMSLSSGGATDVTLQWAVGTCDGGRREVLGVWQSPPLGCPAWKEPFDDLALRGVERIRFVVSAHADAAQAALLGATILTPGTQHGCATPGTTSAPPARLRRIAESAQKQASLMQSELERQIHRHGPFDSNASALDFLEKALERLDRRFWTDAPVRAHAARRRPAESRATAV
jgi:transposase-like protein